MSALRTGVIMIGLCSCISPKPGINAGNGGGGSSAAAGGGGPMGGGFGGGSTPTDAGPRDSGFLDAGPPDLVALAGDGGMMIEWRNIDVQWCEVTRGCVGSSGDRALLHYSFRLANIGGGAVDLTAPDAGS